MRVTLTGPWAGVVVAAVGLYLLLAPAHRLGRPSSVVFKGRPKPPPLWTIVFLRVLGVLLLALAAALLWPALT